MRQAQIDIRTANQLVLSGVRFAAILLGLDSDALLYRFILQEAQEWLIEPTSLSVHVRARLMAHGVAAPARNPDLGPDGPVHRPGKRGKKKR